jgi:acetyl esterase/lipase
MIHSKRSNHLFARAAIVLVALIIGGAACFAQTERQPRIPDDVQLTSDVEFGKGGGRALKLDILRPKDTPKDRMPAVIFIHGGGWRGGRKEVGIQRLIPLAQHGYFCATIEYRLSDEATFPAQIEDCKCAVRWLRAHAKEYNVDPKRIGVWGSSAGGHLVALLGTSGGAKDLEGKGGWEKESSRVQAVVDFFGPTDLLKIIEHALGNSYQRRDLRPDDSPVTLLLGGVIEEKRDLAAKASPITYVSKDDPPFLIVHGDQDPLVPLKQSETFYEALKKAGVDSTLQVVKGAGHGFPGHPEVDQMVLDFFDKQLNGGGK